MSYLKSLNFHTQGVDSNADYLWLSNNVDFIYSCILTKEKTITNGIRKLNVFLGPSSRLLGDSPYEGIADVWVASNAAQLISEPKKFQDELVVAANDALRQISEAGYLSSTAAVNIASAVALTGLEYEYPLRRSMRDVASKRRFSLILRTRFSTVSVGLKERNGQVFHLLEFWPSPWLVLMKFLGATFIDDGRLQLDFRYNHGDVDNEKFGRPLISADKSDLFVYSSLASVSIEGGSREVMRFIFDMK